MTLQPIASAPQIAPALPGASGLRIETRPNTNSESMAGTGSYEVEPLSPGRTRLHTSVEIHPRGLARLAEPLISRSIKKEDNVDLASLKELLEQADHTLT